MIRGFHVHHNVVNTSPIESPSLQMLSVEQFPPGLHIKPPALKELYLGGALRADIHTAGTLLRGVCSLKTLSFFVDHFHDARLVEWTLELDDLIFFCDDTTSPEAFQSVLQSLGSHSTVYSLTRISINIWNPKPSSSGPSISIMHVLLTIIKSWEKNQFPKLRSVFVHVSDDRSEAITFTIADLMRVGADRGLGIEVNSSPLTTEFLLPFWFW